MAHADGTIFYRADRKKWVAVLDGYQMAARNSVEACRNFLINKRFQGQIVVIGESDHDYNVRTKLPHSVYNVPDKSSDICTWIKTTAASVIAEANAKFSLSLNPTIEFCRGRAAGWAQGTGLLKFNTILAEENKEIFPQTIKHEVAHLVVNAKYRHSQLSDFFGRRRAIRPHGPEFMNILKQLGGEPKRCHNMDVSNSMVRRSTKIHKATCACQTHMVTAKVLARITTYRCRKCRTYLKAA